MMFSKKGLTLIELLIVVAIIAILASVIFVALNPLKRLQDSRNAVRWEDAENVLNAIKLDQLDNGGDYMSNIQNLTAGVVYMITDVGVGSGCNDYNTYCDTNIVDSDDCVSLNDLVTEGYLGAIPVSPEGDVAWDEDHTGYTIEKNTNGSITIRACESEGSSDEIELLR